MFNDAEMNNDCIVFCQRYLADNIHHAGARWVRRVCVWVHVAMENGDGSSRVYCNRYMHETDEEQYWDGYRRIHCHNQSVAEMPAADAAVAGQKKKFAASTLYMVDPQAITQTQNHAYCRWTKRKNGMWHVDGGIACMSARQWLHGNVDQLQQMSEYM